MEWVFLGITIILALILLACEVADAARDKALAAAFEAVEPLAKALECTLADHTSDKHKYNCTCPAWDGYRAALANYQALKLDGPKAPS